MVAQDNGQRERVTAQRVTGTLIEWKGKFGWIKPNEKVKHPLASSHQGKIYVSERDLEGGEIALKGPVSFFVYADASGLGALHCRPAAAAAAAAAVKQTGAKAQGAKGAAKGATKGATKLAAAGKVSGGKAAGGKGATGGVIKTILKSQQQQPQQQAPARPPPERVLMRRERRSSSLVPLPRLSRPAVYGYGDAVASRLRRSRRTVPRASSQPTRT
mmetsp:Transcript_39822/g.86923  ORF Transcript_39822/g.86923 Transcript_39822/m.86923 type:complete len:216 (-) Transcript_39822:55-702(-)